MQNKTKGFSLVELIVVIAIMVVLMGMLVPALIGYSENTRADKDTAQMQEVVAAIEMAMTNEKIYDDLLLYAVENNYSCYIDGDPTTNMAVNRIENFNAPGNAEGVVGAEDLWSYGDEARMLPKTQYTPSGKMCGLTITFVHNYDTNAREFDIGNALINNMSPSHKKSNTIKLKDLTTDGNTYLYEYLKDVVSESITTSSNKYKNSEYTVFIRMVPVGVDYTKYEGLTIDVYGQWSGSHLGTDTRRDSLDEVDGVDIITPGSYGETPNAPVPVGPVPGVGITPQEPKAVATFSPPRVKENIVYNQRAQALIEPGSTEEGTMYYKVKGDAEWSTAIPRRTDAGQYEVYYYVKGDIEHYNSQEYSLVVTIHKATPNYSVPTAVPLFANGQSQELVRAGTVHAGGKMMYKLSTTGYSEAVPVGKAPGTYTVIWKIQESDNYNAYPETTIEVTISKLQLNLQPPVARDLTYNGAMQQLVDPCVITAPDMTDNLPVIEYSLNGTSWSQNIPSGLNAGTYTVFYRANSNAFFEGTDGTSSVEVTIKKADPKVVIQWNDKVKYMANVAQTFVDDVQQDSPNAIFFKIYPEGTDGSSVPFSPAYPSATAANVYTVEWFLPEDANYLASGSGTNPNTKTVEIEKAMASDVNKISVIGATWTYDTKRHSAVVANSTGWNVVFTDSAGNTSTTPPTAINAGTYTYTWTATHDAFDTETGVVTLQCNKAPVRVLAAPQGGTAAGSAQRVIRRTSAGAVLGTIYKPKTVELTAGLTSTGACTQGGRIVFKSQQTVTKTFLTASGSSSIGVPCYWECVPINSNYYIEGTASGSTTIRFTFTVTTIYKIG